MRFKNFEIISVFKGKEIWWMDIVFWFFVAFLVLTILFYFILDIGISRQERKIKKFETEIERFGGPEQKELERKVFGYEAKIKEVKKLVEAHKIPSNYFKLAEEITLPEIYFKNLKLDTSKPEVQFEGVSPDFKKLATQLSLFEQEKNIKEITNFGSSLSNEGKVNFAISLGLLPDLFLWK